MENQELMQYLKDAIELETDIAQQENLIEQFSIEMNQRKPQLVPVTNNWMPPPSPPEPSYSNAWIFGLVTLIIVSFLTLPALFRDPDDVAILTAFTVLPSIAVTALCAFDAYRRNAKEKETYEHILLTHEKHRADIEAENKKLSADHKWDMSEWEASFQSIKSHMTAPLTESQGLLEKFYANDVIYPKYRNLPALTSIYEYFVTGRCTELTGPHGAYNLYEDELRKDTVISQLNTVIENLEQIRQNQYMLYQQVKGIQENTAVIASELQQIKGYTIQIAQLTALNAYYAKRTERNTRITMYYHL